MRDEFAGVDIAGRDIEGLDIDGLDIAGLDVDGRLWALIGNNMNMQSILFSDLYTDITMTCIT